MNLFLYAVIFIFCLWFVFFFSSHLLLFQCLGIFTLLWCSINSSILLGWLPVQYALRICIVCRCWRCVCVCVPFSFSRHHLFVCLLPSVFFCIVHELLCVATKTQIIYVSFPLGRSSLSHGGCSFIYGFFPDFSTNSVLLLNYMVNETREKNLFCFIISICISCACSTKVYTHFSWETTVFSFLFWVLFSNNVHLVLTDCWHFLIFFNIWRW